MRLIVNAKIYVERDRFAQALLIDDAGRIAAVGENARVRATAPADTPVYDAGGKTIVPGFIDSHLHLLMTGSNLCEIALHRVDSIEALIVKSRDFIERTQPPAGSVLHGMGWNQALFAEQRMPTREDLDRISTEHALVLERTCCHVAVCNSRALAMAGIGDATPDPEGGCIDRVNGVATGIVRESAMELVRPLYRELTPEATYARLRAATRHAATFGVTSVQSCDLYGPHWETTWNAFARLQETEPAVRVTHQFHFQTTTELAAFFARGLKMGSGNALNRVGPLKLFLDGSLGARTAWMRAPYRDEPTTSGISTLSNETFDALVNMAQTHETGVIVHAIGDAAVEQALNAFERADPTHANALRNGIVHLEITDRKQLERVARQRLLRTCNRSF